ncbi:SPOR domain-containing protein [Salinivibrio sp. ES.052]|uniref:SPOR domain-containing protein n=1 Tax=Salinivibrio sp. ES.052 TaxID=1882823 RepID=UPI00092BDA9E|nr:SPOR domain-containing protein [Salinivibrio sp. ES.052]SIO23500.1 hypothetical protein SAMN05444724_2303 [Salinivibrio sp. ES.052]
MGRWRGLVISLVVTWGMSTSVNAAQTPCAIIDNQQGWPIIGETCDIGNGLWGNESPDPQSSAFWVQCGATKGVPSRQFYQSLRQGLPDLPFQVQVREGRGRCLIGPYQNLDVASLVLKRVRQFGPTQQAVLRQTRQPLSEPAVIRLPPLAETASSERSTMKANTVNLNHFGLPEPEAGDKQYTEKAMNWLRVPYAEAAPRCQQEGMVLASQQDLTQVAKATDQLPMRLPYWVQGALGVDAKTGAVVTRNQDAALNVLCKKR